MSLSRCRRLRQMMASFRSLCMPVPSMNPTYERAEAVNVWDEWGGAQQVAAASSRPFDVGGGNSHERRSVARAVVRGPARYIRRKGDKEPASAAGRDCGGEGVGGYQGR